MTRLTFTVKAIWDEDAEVFFSESDISGLHIEAGNIEEFEEIMHNEALELVLANHVSKVDMAQKTLAEWLPTIFWCQPDQDLAVA